MSRSSFFSGLAQGVFGEQTKIRAEKEKQINDEKSSALKLLTSMVDQVDPESRPTLLKHIGSVMGLRGKDQGIWARLTGADLDSDRGALHSTLGQILGQVQGPYKPEPKKQITGMTSVGGFPVPTGTVTPAQPRNPQAMYLRDPQAEELTQLGARYGLQRQMGLDRLEFQNDLVTQRQRELEELRTQNRLEVQEAAAVNKWVGPLMQRAYMLSRGQQPTQEQMESAALALEQETGIKSDKLLAQIGYLKARTNKTETEVLSGGKPMTEAQNENFARNKQRDAEATFKQWTDQRAMADAVGRQLQAVYDDLNSLAKSNGATYDAQKSTFLNQQGQPDTDLNTFYSTQINKARELQRQKDSAMVKLQGYRDTLATSYGDYYSTYDTPWTVSPRVYDATSQTYKKTGTGSQAPSVGESTTVIGTASRPASGYQVNQIISQGGRKFKVVDVQPPSAQYPYGSFTALPVK